MMSSVTTQVSTETTNNSEDENNSTNDDSEILHVSDDDTSLDATPTNFDTTDELKDAGAAQIKKNVLPVVYLHTPNLPTVVVTKANSLAHIKFATISANSTPKIGKIIKTTKNVASGKPPAQIVLQKKPGQKQNLTKMGALFTMIKPVTKQGENVNKIDALNTSILHTTSTGQKYVISSLPKVTSSGRMATTSTTSSVQSKITLMSVSSDSLLNKRKVINFKISDGQIQSSSNQAITVLNTSFANNKAETKNMHCDEVIDLDDIEDDDDEGATITKCEPTFVVTKAKDAHKYQPKHVGVSILKRNFSIPERRSLSAESTGNNVIIHSIATIPNSLSDAVTVTKPSTGAEETIILSDPEPKLEPEVEVKPEPPKAVPPSQQKAGRRKSNFSYRKDYDDNDFQFPSTISNTIANKFTNPSSEISLTKLSTVSDSNVNKIKNLGCMDIEVTKEKPDINMNDEVDLRKMLEWDEFNIGSLPGSSIKFIINEFDMLEYVTQGDYKTLVEKKSMQKAEFFQQEMRCVECGCFGLPSDFISPKYCSHTCQEAYEQKVGKDKFKKKKKPFPNPRKFEFSNSEAVVPKVKLEVKKEEPKEEIIKKDLSESDEEPNTSNENSQDKYAYPWNCSKKGFSWSKYLDHIKAQAAPVKLFKDPFPYNRNGFRPGMKLEGVDPVHLSHFCVLTVAEVMGYRMRLHFDGYPDKYDFWVNADSLDVFPIGWCEKHGHELHPPPSHSKDNFNWFQYLKVTKSSGAPKHLFANRAGNAICPNGFRIGMKLEAVDKKDSSLVCVASVKDMMDNRILVHFDSWDDIYDYWVDPSSPYIHPVGWSDQKGHDLTPPNDYPSKEDFTWDNYLKETKSVAVPVRAFKQRPACGFKRGMRLECVDRRVPQLIRVATVKDVKDHQLLIHFDGWLDKYSYWVDDDNQDIHPVGWCHKTGHPIEPPLTPECIYDCLECPVIGCKGIGHVQGHQYATHSSDDDCPYSLANYLKEKILPDRLLSPDRKIEAVVPVSREPKEKTKRLGRPPKYRKVEVEKIKSEDEDDSSFELTKRKRKVRKSPKVEVAFEDKVISLLKESTEHSEAKAQFSKHSKFLTDLTEIKQDPMYWSTTEVANFITKLPTCEKYGSVFEENEIDGESLLMLSQRDIIDILDVKLGPAIKVYNSILLLRRNTYQKT